MAERDQIANASPSRYKNEAGAHALGCYADANSPTMQKNDSPRSVAASSSQCIPSDAPPAPYPCAKQKSKSSTSSFLPSLMSMLSLSFESEDGGDDDQGDYDTTSSTEHLENSETSETGMLRSILRSSFHKACNSGCSNPGVNANAMRKSVSFSKNLNEVESIPTIDLRIKAKQRSQSMSNLRNQHKTKTKTKNNTPARNNTICHLASSLTCVSNITCGSFRYYSPAVDANTVPMMSVYNIDDDNEEDWE